MSSILFVGGGSVGHIAPAVAVARALQEQNTNIDITFVCSQRKEDSEFLAREKMKYVPLDAPRLSLTFPWKFWRAYHKASLLLKTLQPKVVFSKGGYVSVPVCLAAHWQQIPIVLHESDVVSGYANKLVSRWAEVICFGFPPQKLQAKSYKLKAKHTGNPICPEITQGKKEEGLRITGFSGNKPILLVMGGSQGSQALNEAVIHNLTQLLETYDIIHLTGSGKQNSVEQSGYWAREFAYEELPHLYAVASVALSRSGAGSIAELSANAIPAVLVPLEGAAHDHQIKNAEAVSQNDQFTLLKQEQLKLQLLETLSKLQQSTVNSQLSTVNSDAARQIAEILSKYLA